MNSLFVIIPDKLSNLVIKGEIVSRYYNPGNLFDEVHIIMTNNDSVNPSDIQKTAGNAKLYIHNLPAGKKVFLGSLGWRPALLRKWAEEAVELAREIRPSLIRCHGNHLNIYVAYQIKKILKIPYIVSLHGNPDIDYFRGRLGRTWIEKIQGRAIEDVEIIGIKEADYIMPVYQSIIPYLKKHNIQKYSVVYNVVGYNCIVKKSYEINKLKVKAICVGRQESLQKDPTPIIDAVLDMPDISLLLIGNGDLHPPLIEKVKRENAEDRISFSSSMPNNEVLMQMHRADIFIYSSINYEISKGTMEAALTGLPVILNDREGDPSPELIGRQFILVNGSKESYKKALSKLIIDDQYRKQMGQLAYAYAQANWAPEKMEMKYVSIYRDIMKKNKGI